MKQKKLMLLGGIRYLLPVIKTAHEQGIYVITADYLPDNVAHKYSDEYVNVSIIDKDAVLKVAQEKKIDGVLSFGVDPGVVSAAYVAEKMGLPFQCSYESACVLQDKSRFRRFLYEHGFNCPKSVGYNSEEEALSEIDSFHRPIIVKPADSAGSKGVTKVENADDYVAAVKTAFDYSISKKIIIEDFLDVVGFQSSTDMFTVDGRLVFPVFSDQVFDSEAANPYVPTVEIWPSTMPLAYQEDFVEQLNRLFGLLHCKNGLYNIECRVCSDGKAYLMEVSPRGGGNHIALLQDMAYGTNFIENEIRAAMNMPLELRLPHELEKNWCTYSIHPEKSQKGTLKSIDFDEKLKKDHLQFVDLAYQAGMMIPEFTGANMSLGDVILCYKTKQELYAAMADHKKWLKTEIE